MATHDELQHLLTVARETCRGLPAGQQRKLLDALKPFDKPNPSLTAADGWRAVAAAEDIMREARNGRS